MGPQGKKNKDPLICLCNGISQKTIEDAITGGCKSLGEIFDKTFAGVGACGGTCQPTLRKMLEEYQTKGKFPEHPRHPDKSRRR